MNHLYQVKITPDLYSSSDFRYARLSSGVASALMCGDDGKNLHWVGRIDEQPVTMDTRITHSTYSQALADAKKFRSHVISQIRSRG